MKKNVWQAFLAGLTALCTLPVPAIPAQAAGRASVDIPMTQVSYVQNDSHLSPRLVTEDGTETQLPVTVKDSAVPGIYRADAALPEAYSLRDDNGSCYVTSVKDQGSTGLCWAYSALGACESNILKQGLSIPDSNLDAKGELNLSEGALGWYLFTKRLQDGDTASGDYVKMDNKGAGGGNASFASFALAAGYGVQLDQYAPYSDWDTGYSEYQRYVSYYDMESSDIIWQVASGSESVIKQWLMESGAVSASFYSYATFYDNDTSKAYYQSTHDAEDANHAILLVGWDDNYAKENFRPGNQPSSDGAWLVRNSWGDDDTYEGYFWLSYEEPSLCEFARFLMTENAGTDTCYQYDGGVSYAGLGASAGANIFTAEKDGTLTRVMFPNLSGNPDQVNYTVSVYRMTAADEVPEDGTLAAQVTGTASYGGYKSVDIPPVSLQKGERFAVCVQFSAKRGSTAPMLAMESTVTDADSIVRYSYYQPGQSYIRSGSQWIDVADLVGMPDSKGNYPYANLGNVAIKAFVEAEDTTVNWTQLQEALDYGAPTTQSCQLYRDAYAAAIQLDGTATQAEVDCAAANLLAGLERQGIIRYAAHLYAKETCLMGDVNENGKVDMSDAYEALVASSMHYAGRISALRPAQVKAADVDSDGTLTITDAYDILLYFSQYSAGLTPQWRTG